METKPNGFLSTDLLSVDRVSPNPQRQFDLRYTASCSELSVSRAKYAEELDNLFPVVFQATRGTRILELLTYHAFGVHAREMGGKQTLKASYPPSG